MARGWQDLYYKKVFWKANRRNKFSAFLLLQKSFNEWKIFRPRKSIFYWIRDGIRASGFYLLTHSSLIISSELKWKSTLTFLQYWAVVVTQLVEQSLPIPEVPGLSPVIGKHWTWTDEKMKIKKSGREWPNFFNFSAIFAVCDVWSSVTRIGQI